MKSRDCLILKQTTQNHRSQNTCTFKLKKIAIHHKASHSTIIYCYIDKDKSSYSLDLCATKIA